LPISELWQWRHVGGFKTSCYQNNKLSTSANTKRLRTCGSGIMFVLWSRHFPSAFGGDDEYYEVTRKRYD
jgi:hypothetical protein